MTLPSRSGASATAPFGLQDPVSWGDFGIASAAIVTDAPSLRGSAYQDWWDDLQNTAPEMPAVLLPWETQTDPAYPTQTPECEDKSEPTVPSVTPEKSLFNFATTSQVWEPPQIRELFLPYSSSATCVQWRILDHYTTSLSSTLTVKKSQWSFFSYITRLVERTPTSPLRNSVLAWAGTHIGLTDSSIAQVVQDHYVAASKQVLTMTADTLTKGSMVTKGMTARRSDMMTMVLLSFFSLCQRDIMTCDCKMFRRHMLALRNLIFDHWRKFRESLNSVGLRILLWLSYLEVRALIWTPSKLFNEPKHPSIIEFLGRNENLHQLYRKSRSYLREAFGADYPSSELRDDMLQDAANSKWLDLMLLTSRIASLKWNGEAKDCNGSMIEVVDERAVRELQADLAEINEVR